MTQPFWISAFLDLPAADFDATTEFWSNVTGYRLSEPRGEYDEFATLLPPDGDDFLRAQRLQDGPAGVHLDLHVPDPRAAAEAAKEDGATEIADLGYVVMRSPGGLTFCFVTHPANTRPKPATWPNGATSLVDQVCLDIPPSVYDVECAFWSTLTGWAESLIYRPEYRRLTRPKGQPIELLLQRLDAGDGPVRAHLDLAVTNRPAEIERHQALGASLVKEHPGWTVMTDPAGSPYCLTGRDPITGVRPGNRGAALTRTH